MCQLRPEHSAVIVLLALTVLPISFAQADETITVRLASGRSFTAVLDGRTNQDHLWLRFESPSASVMRPIAWNRLEAVLHNGRSLDRSDLLAMRDAAQASSAEAAGTPASPSDEEVAIVMSSPPLPLGRPAAADAALRPPPQATQIAIAATLENWDADPQPDGLLLHLELLDAGGYRIAAAGTLQAELFAPLQRRFQDLPHSRGASVQPVGRWSEAVGTEDFSRGAAAIRLPFVATRPVATDLASPYGLLHVRLAVPGHGVFEASYDGIRIRRFTPTRDLLQRQDRRRTMFTEPPRREW